MQRNPEIDFGIISDGEIPFAQLLKNLNHPEKVSNLVFRRNGKIQFTDRQMENFNSIPFPARELFDMRPYQMKRYAISVQSKRGCGFNCIFCPNEFLVGKTYRLRSPKKVVDEIEHLVNNYDIDCYFFVDSTFNHPYEHSRRICQELIARKLYVDWSAEFTPNFLNKESLKEAVKSGCKFFFFSPDGASDMALKILGKDFQVQHIEKTISIAREVEGANVGYNFMYDLPDYNSEHKAGLVRLVTKMIFELRQKLYLISLTKMRIYPHTKLQEIAVKEGKLSQGSNLLFPHYYSDTSSLGYENVIPELLRKSTSFFDVVTRKSRKHDF